MSTANIALASISCRRQARTLGLCMGATDARTVIGENADEYKRAADALSGWGEYASTAAQTVSGLPERWSAVWTAAYEAGAMRVARQWAAAYGRGESDGRVAYEQSDDGDTMAVWVTTRHGSDPTYVNAARSFWDGVHGSAAAEEGLDADDEMLRMAHAEGFWAGWND